MTSRRSRSFEQNDALTVVDSRGQRVHRDTVSHMEMFPPRLHSVGGKAWCVVGNGLSNQTFIDAPEGIIA
ncbi:MAG: hypothetical protein EB132_03200, partial [Actinobacteria bacterium]|nr:hypothetical protein [Actinomycetota bacterium]